MRLNIKFETMSHAQAGEVSTRTSAALGGHQRTITDRATATEGGSSSSSREMDTDCPTHVPSPVAHKRWGQGGAWVAAQGCCGTSCGTYGHTLCVSALLAGKLDLYPPPRPTHHLPWGRQCPGCRSQDLRRSDRFPPYPHTRTHTPQKIMMLDLISDVHGFARHKGNERGET